MHRVLVRRPDTLIVLLAGYFLMEFVVRLAMPASMRYDESQQAFFSQWLAYGYDSQPPLYNWVHTLFVSLFGLSIATVAAVKNISLFLVYITYYMLARQLLTDRFFAVVATLSLLTIPQLSWEAQRDLTHTVAQLLAINVFLYGIVRTLKAPSIASYAMIGATLGLGMLSKYNFAVFAAAALVATWFHPEGRARLFDKRLLLTLLIAFVIFLPHGLWLIDNIDVASGRTLGIMSQDAPTSAVAKFVKGPLEFFKRVIIICAPTFVVYALIFRRDFIGNLRRSNEWTRFFEIIFAATCVLLLVLIIAIGMTGLRDRWLLPFLFQLPLYLCLKMEVAGVKSEAFAKRFVYVPLVIMLVIPVALLGRVNNPGLFKNYEAYNVPYADFVGQVMASEGKKPGLVMTDDWLPAGNLHMQLPDVPVMSRFFGNLQTAYEWTKERPILLVWLPDNGVKDMPATLSTWLSDKLGPRYAHADVKEAKVGYISGKAGDAVRFAYSWVYP